MNGLCTNVDFLDFPFLPPATKLGQGYIFTGVWDSVDGGGGGGGVWSGGGVCGPGGVSALGGCGPLGVPAPGGVSGPRGGVWSLGVSSRHPPGRPLLRAVRILLECILV